MFDASARAMRRAVAVCLGVLVVLVLALAPTQAGAGAGLESTTGNEPLVIRHESRAVFAYPPAATATTAASARRPAVVYLNGLCGVTTNGCPHFHEGVAPFGWLVCPPANAKCPGGGASWSGPPSARRAVIDAAVSDVAQAFPELVDASAPTVLVGFSQGAYTALDVARVTPSKYTGLLLIGADVEPTPESLRAAGVTRIALAAGAGDMAAAPMRMTATALAAAGVDARYFSLGKVGHTYVADTDHTHALTEALAWVEGREGI